MTRRSLGQHYLVDPEVIERTVGVASVRPWERVLEIGTGRGALTRKLIGLGASLECYEVDRRNLNDTQAITGRGALVKLGDAFKERPEFDVLVSSLPYSKSAVFVEWLAGLEYDRAVVLLQRDFVGKITAVPGSSNYRAVSVIAQISANIKTVCGVGREAFSPPPKVDSSLVIFRPKLRLPKQSAVLVKKLFSLRKRKVSVAAAKLNMLGAPEEYGRRRVYSLTPAEVSEVLALGSWP